MTAEHTSPPSGRKAADDARKPRAKAGWPSIAIAIVFGLLYAYDLFAAIANTLGVSAEIARYNEFAALNGVNTKVVPWVALVAQLLVPLVVYLLAFLIGRRRRLLTQALLFAAGLGLVSALYLSLNVLGGLLVR